MSTGARVPPLGTVNTTPAAFRLQVQHIEGKGRGVFATRCFRKGEYVVEYHGDLLQITDAKKREVEYAQNPTTGCYMYYFQYRCKTYWYGKPLLLCIFQFFSIYRYINIYPYISIYILILPFQTIFLFLLYCFIFVFWRHFYYS